ncbi:MAG: hypothetical protein QF479_06795, partial [Candidatus Poseidoniaceae archaeon]|nr:hypothetical protein [Candidatus Poseidoniaceae archaeon]
GLRSSSWIIEIDTSQENQSTEPIEDLDSDDVNSVETYKLAGFISLVIIFGLFTVIFVLDYKIKKV